MSSERLLFIYKNKSTKPNKWVRLLLAFSFKFEKP